MVNSDFSQKSQNFPRVFYAPADGVPLAIGYRARSPKKLEWWGYRAEKEFDDIFSPLDIIQERDGQTDKRTDTERKQNRA